MSSATRIFSASVIAAIMLANSAFAMCGGAQDLPPPPPIQPPPTRSNTTPQPFHTPEKEKAKADASPSDTPDAKTAGDDEEIVMVRPAANANKDAIAELVELISKLGANTPSERKAALEKIRAAGEAAFPVMLSLLDPKQKIDEFTRVEILRWLQDQSPVSDKTSKILAWVATHDPYLEARREACRVIRKTQDDTAIKELVRYANSNDATVRAATAWASREIDYDPLFLSFIKAMQNTDDKAMQHSVNTSATPNADSPASEIMRAIARKNLGILGINWQPWYNEKTGQALGSDYHETRTARSLMGKD